MEIELEPPCADDSIISIVDVDDPHVMLCFHDSSLEEAPTPKKKRVAPKVTGYWCDADIAQLILGVETQPCLWDVSASTNKNRNIRDAAWQAVTQSFGGRYTGKQCANKWQCLRAVHRKELAKIKTKKSGQAASESPRWKYFKAMAFVAASAAACETYSENNDKKFTSFQPTHVSEEVEPGDLSTDTSRPPSSAPLSKLFGVNSSGIAARKRKASTAVTDKRAEEREKALQLLDTVATTLKAKPPADEWSTFGDHVAAKLRSLPNTQGQMSYRKMSRCMLDFLDEICLETTSSAESTVAETNCSIDGLNGE